MSTFESMYVVLSRFALESIESACFSKATMNGRRSASSVFPYKRHTNLFRILCGIDSNVLAESSFCALFSIRRLFVRRSLWPTRACKYSTTCNQWPMFATVQGSCSKWFPYVKYEHFRDFPLATISIRSYFCIISDFFVEYYREMDWIGRCSTRRSTWIVSNFCNWC